MASTIKIMPFSKRRQGMTPEEYKEYRNKIFAPLALSQPVIGYKQSYCIPRMYANGAEPAMDGFASNYFPSLEVMKEAGSSPQAALNRQHSPKYQDMNTVKRLPCTEYIVIDGPVNSAMVKAVIWFNRKAGMTPQQCHQYWLETHTPLYKKVPGVRRMVQNHALYSAYEDKVPWATPWDGCLEVWYDNLEAYNKAHSSPEFAAMRVDDANYMDPASVGVILVHEEVFRELPREYLNYRL